MPLWLLILLAAALAMAFGLVWWRVPRLRGWLRIALIVALLLAIIVRWWPSRPRPADWAAVPRWLTCIDCTTGELDSLVAQAQRDSVVTVSWLRDALVLGPGDARMEDLGRTLDRMYRRDSSFAALRDTTLHLGPRDAYVAGYLARFDGTWRARAAIGLGRIQYVYDTLPPLGAWSHLAGAALDSAVSVITNSAVLLAIARARDPAYIGNMPH
jgi:hypothetical protein